jgi:hypothetical protein
MKESFAFYFFVRFDEAIKIMTVDPGDASSRIIELLNDFKRQHNRQPMDVATVFLFFALLRVFLYNSNHELLMNKNKVI